MLCGCFILLSLDCDDSGKDSVTFNVFLYYFVLLHSLNSCCSRRWNRYWESDLLSPAVDSVANRQESDTLLNKA